MKTNAIYETSTYSVHLFNHANHNTEKEIIKGIQFCRQYM